VISRGGHRRQAAESGSDERFTSELVALQPFVSERFVSVTGKLISLSEQGRPFVRLIASVFDSYLQESGNRHSVAV